MQKSDWERALESAGLSTRQKAQHRLIIRWFLGYCQKRQPPAAPGRDLANEFDRELRRNRKPLGWQLEQWRTGLRWWLEFMAEKPAAAKAQPSAPPADKGTWRQTMIGQARLKHLSYRTEQTYLEWVSRFAGFLNGRNPLTATDADAVGFLTELAVRKQVAGATQNQAFNALLFFYRNVLGREDVLWVGVERAQKKRRQPTVATPSELTRVFAELDGTTRLMVRLLYGSGLRLMELIRLRVQHLDFGRGVVVVRGGKGDKDRETTLPVAMEGELQEHLKRVKWLFEEDRVRNTAGVWLPESLARKYPKAGQQWIWQWVFPSRQLSRDPRSGALRRHHVQENAIQKALAEAARRAGLNKRVTPHVLRHSFASHLLDGGTDIRTLQSLLGHSSVETTQIYLHVMRKPGLGVRSPLDG
jgi:integron integrase